MVTGWPATFCSCTFENALEISRLPSIPKRANADVSPLHERAHGLFLLISLSDKDVWMHIL